MNPDSSTVYLNSANPNGGDGGFTTHDKMPAGRDILVQCEGNTNLYFWNDALGTYSATPVIVAAPGDRVTCPNKKVKITGASPVSIRLYLGDWRQP